MKTMEQYLAELEEDRKPGGKLDQLKAGWENLKRTPCDCSQYKNRIDGEHNRDAHTTEVS